MRFNRKKEKGKERKWKKRNKNDIGCEYMEVIYLNCG